MYRPLKVLLIVTCYNRKATTLKFLNSLREKNNSPDIEVHTVIMDDSSPDGTGEAVKQNFPEVEVIYGNGNLYWAGGVRLVLKHLAERVKSFDAILFANDDIEFEANAIHQMAELAHSRIAIVGGTVLTRDGRVESTGSRLGLLCKPKVRLVVANGQVQECQLLPGHILYVPMNVYDEIGIDPELPYRFIDLEMTLRASRKGIPVLLAPKPLAITNDYHDYYKETSSMRGSIRDLTRNILLDPKGPHWRESMHYLKKVSPLLWWLWLPLFYRAFFVAVVMSKFESLKSFFSVNRK
jgi:GT2 family glycosyltransferase